MKPTRANIEKRLAVMEAHPTLAPVAPSSRKVIDASGREWTHIFARNGYGLPDERAGVVIVPVKLTAAEWCARARNI